MADKVDEKTLQQTSTWAVAVVCFFLLLFSIVIEKLIHKLGTYFLILCFCVCFVLLGSLFLLFALFLSLFVSSS
ncbi:hypothetical protein F2Q70_00001674 [Brassica cretica]|uniref:Uncharacterized protein n=1 Tax=Brassica cretica TaxID=69181 RepID=A0A8S9ILA9_BRACR|nr:hypothetical protein F2Q70_00001674 [Brassica cretica]